MQFKPRNGNIVVVKAGRAGMTSGAHGASIVIPDAAQKESESAVVAAVSDPWVDAHGILRETQFKVLDCVLVSKYSGETFTMPVDGRERTFTVMQESAVLCSLLDFAPADGGPLPTIGRAAPAPVASLGDPDNLMRLEDVSAPYGGELDNPEMDEDAAAAFRESLGAAR